MRDLQVGRKWPEAAKWWPEWRLERLFDRMGSFESDCKRGHKIVSIASRNLMMAGMSCVRIRPTLSELWECHRVGDDSICRTLDLARTVAIQSDLIQI